MYIQERSYYIGIETIIGWDSGGKKYCNKNYNIIFVIMKHANICIREVTILFFSIILHIHYTYTYTYAFYFYKGVLKLFNI